MSFVQDQCKCGHLQAAHFGAATGMEGHGDLCTRCGCWGFETPRSKTEVADARRDACSECGALPTEECHERCRCSACTYGMAEDE